MRDPRAILDPGSRPESMIRVGVGSKISGARPLGNLESLDPSPNQNDSNVIRMIRPEGNPSLRAGSDR